jgi:hypothetical protein
MITAIVANLVLIYVLLENLHLRKLMIAENGTKKEYQQELMMQKDTVSLFSSVSSEPVSTALNASRKSLL